MKKALVFAALMAISSSAYAVDGYFDLGVRDNNGNYYQMGMSKNGGYVGFSGGYNYGCRDCGYGYGGDYRVYYDASRDCHDTRKPSGTYNYDSEHGYTHTWRDDE